MKERESTYSPGFTFKQVIEQLPRFIEDYRKTKEDYDRFVSHGDSGNIQALHFWRHKFAMLKSNLSPFMEAIVYLKSSRDQKSLTHKKAAIAEELIGETTEEGDNITFTKARDMYAAASKEYKDFLEEKDIYNSTYLLIKQLDSSIDAFTNEIAGRVSRYSPPTA